MYFALIIYVIGWLAGFFTGYAVCWKLVQRKPEQKLKTADLYPQNRFPKP